MLKASIFNGINMIFGTLVQGNYKFSSEILFSEMLDLPFHVKRSISFCNYNLVIFQIPGKLINCDCKSNNYLFP